jgi:serine/threonine protein kinase
MPELRLQHCRLDARYDILECLGRGSYAEIYKAHDNAAPEDCPETVVIKALNLLLQEEPDLELERTLVANFQNEAVALDRVRHPNIISRLGHGTAIDLDGTEFHYIVLEYLPGGDMAALSRNNPLPLERARAYLEQVCSGLAHAHLCGVIHRDIKPQNLLLSADKQTAKIADFGVARLEATEGAITRVGTNIYSAPEHHPLMQTDQLDMASLLAGRQHLTPAADIYSLAKTTYTLLAGEPPRRFSQRAITELPQSLGDHYWAKRVLNVLERATRSRPEDRYQTVQEFWEEFADATLSDTQELPASMDAEAQRKTTADLKIEPEEITQAPPRPHFALSPIAGPRSESVSFIPRPRIVVPVTQAPVGKPGANGVTQKPTASQLTAAFPDQRTTVGRGSLNGRAPVPQGQTRVASRGKRSLVAMGLILGFSGMLLATHRYVTSLWNPLLDIPALANTFIVGREGVTSTDVNLRGDPSTDNQPLGLAENGSRVRVLSVNGNWYEVQVLQHGRPRTDQYTLDQGWVNKKYLKLD